MNKSTFLRLLAVLLVIVLVGTVACKSSKNKATPTSRKTAVTRTPSGTSAPGGNVPGVTATEVTLGTHTSLTGPIAAYNVIPRYTLQYFNYINDTEGGVNGRKINYIEKDDAYNPAQAVDLTHTLVEQNHVFAMFNALGTPNHLQVIDYLQEQGVPDMFVATGATEWVKDPAARPLVFGSNPNYEGEGVAIGKYIAENYPGKKVGVIYQNDDFGQDGVKGLKLGIGSLQLVGQEPYEVTDPDLNSQVDQLKSAGADVVAFWATPLLLATGIKHARADLNWDAPFFISSVSVNELTSLLAGGGTGCGANNQDAQGCLIDGTIGPVATYTAQETSNTGVANHIQILSQHTDLGSHASVLTLYAQLAAELMIQTLKTAQEPLTRDSLIKAAENIRNWKCSVCLFPINLSATDHDPAQSIAMGVFQGGQVKITNKGYTWEGVKIADLSADTVTNVAVPADAVNAQ